MKRMKEFRVIIAGGRDFTDYAILERKMDHLLSRIAEPIVIICGKARGTDTLGEQYARNRGYQVREFPANWDLYGKKAGYIRNEEMAKNADALVAFWDGESRGTKHMIDLAQKYELMIRIQRYKKNNSAALQHFNKRRE